MTRWKRLAVAVVAVVGLGYGYWRLAIPKHRVPVRSELVMLGDLDGDRRWGEGDLRSLDAFLSAPAAFADGVAWRLDLNRNGLLDEEDLAILRALVAAKGDPYEALERAGGIFPRPRELYRFVSRAEPLIRPTWALPWPGATTSVLRWLSEVRPPSSAATWRERMDADLYAEAVRFDQAWRLREPDLSPVEREYAARKLAYADDLFRRGERFELLLTMMGLVEDAETLAAPRADDEALRLLALRDHLRGVLASETFAEFAAGRTDWRPVAHAIAAHLEEDVGLDVDLETLGPARDFTNLRNYLDRTEWQVHKSAARTEDLAKLVAFAQHDPRYLRAVARTSRRHQDPAVENHDLAMVILFREALRLTGGDKKRAVGLLDEAIRSPYAWIKSIPREALPGSLAMDNFLLPGNMEDGADKSRHWNVFGGICLYRSPQQALQLALRREMQDLREGGYEPDAMTEFLRDTIANLNGMYHVMSVDPGLLQAPK